MASGLLIDYLGSGPLASRPATPTLFAGTVGIYYATDVGSEKITLWDGTTWADAPGTGSGDVSGPASSTDGFVALFDGTTGKLLKQGSSTLATVAYSGAYSALSGLPTLGTVAALSYPGGTTDFLRADGTFAAPAGTTYTGTAGSITLTGSAFSIDATYVGQTSITTLGTVATGTWNGTAIGPTYGGTGLTSYTTGDIVYASASNVLSKLAAGTNGYVLTLAAGVPTWAAAASGSGDVVGPASAVTLNFAVFNGTTGKLIQDGGATVASKANLASPTFTGTPAAPTASAGTSTTQIATTAFVNSVSIQTVTSASTVTPTFLNDEVTVTALAANVTLANPTGTAKNGWGVVIRIKDNGTARTISYGTQYRAIGITLPTTTVANKTLYLGMIFNSADTKWDVLSVGQEA